MAKVFISYSRKDIDFAKKLTVELQKSELDFWIDWEGIPPTVDWWKEIEKGIEEADIFLFLISPDSTASQVCGKEIDHAIKNGKRIVPIVVHEIDWDSTPSQLGHLNYIFFSRDDDFDTAIRKLLTGIHTDYEWAATHRRLQVKALEWERNHKENSFLLRGKDLQEAELQLATNTSKDPHPTDLQREYVNKSRQVTDRQRRITMVVATIGIIALAVLAVYGFIQAGLATENANSAQLAQQDAENQAQQAQAANTAVVQAQSTTVAALIETEEELKKARNQQLSAQAELTSGDFPSRSALLALEAIKINADSGDPITFEAKQALLNGLANNVGIPLSGNTSPILSIKFSADGRWIASGASNGSVLVWDRQDPEFTKSPTYSFTTGITDIHLIRYYQDAENNHILVAAGAGEQIYFWNLSEPDPSKSLIEIETELPAIDDMEISPNGKWLAVGFGPENKVLFFDLESISNNKKPTSNLVVENAGYSDNIMIEFSHNSQYLLAVNGARMALWALYSGLPVLQVKDVYFYDSKYIAINPTSVSFTATDRQIIAGNLIWPTESFLTEKPLPLPSNYYALSQDGIWLAGGNIAIYNLNNGTAFSVKGHQGPVTNLMFSSDGRWLVSASALNPTGYYQGDGTLRIWDMTSNDVENSASVYKVNSDISTLDVDPRGEWVAVSSENNFVRLIPLSISEKQLLQVRYGVTLPEAINERIHISSDDKWLVYARESVIPEQGHEVQIADLTVGYPASLQVIVNFGELIQGINYTSDSRWLIVSAWENQCYSDRLCREKIYFFDLINKQFDTPFMFSYDSGGSAGRFIAGHFVSEDGKLFIARDGTNTTIIDIKNSDPGEKLFIPGAAITDISPDNRFAAGFLTATGDFALFDLNQQNPADNAISLFSSAYNPIEFINGQLIELVDSPGFSPDGGWIYFTECKYSLSLRCGTRTIHFWDVDSENPTETEIVIPMETEAQLIFSENNHWAGILATDGTGTLLNLAAPPYQQIGFDVFDFEGPIAKITFSPDNRWLALLNASGKAALVDLQSPNLDIIKPDTLSYQITDIQFNPASDILSGSTLFDITLIWEIPSLTSDPSSSPILSRGGDFVTQDGEWYFSILYQDLLDEICPSVGRNLTRAEWIQYGFTEDYRQTCPQYEIE